MSRPSGTEINSSGLFSRRRQSARPQAGRVALDRRPSPWAACLSPGWGVGEGAAPQPGGVGRLWGAGLCAPALLPHLLQF